MKKLSEKHQEIYDQRYPDGYVVPEGEKGLFHIMFINIIKDGKWTRGVPFIQKYSSGIWAKMKRAIEDPVIGIGQTGHDEYAVLWDPIEAKAEAKAKAEAVAKSEKEAFAKAEAKEKAKEGEAVASKNPAPKAVRRKAPQKE